jgi:YD repeat-containing protein
MAAIATGWLRHLRWGVLAFAACACGAGERVVPVPAAAAPEAAASACAGEPSRQLLTIEQRSSESSAVAKVVRQVDQLGRLLRVERDLDGDGVVDQVDRYDYDEQGRLIEVANAEGTERYQLDGAGRIAVRERHVAGSPLVSSVVITYDEQGRPLRERSDLEDVSYAYAAAGREVRERRVRAGDEVPYLDITTTSDAAGRPLLQRGYNDHGEQRKTWRYDEQGRELETQWVRGGILILRTSMHYDADGRRDRQQQFDGQGRLVGVQSWTYDATGAEASQRTESLISNTWEEERYTYAPARGCGKKR